MKIRSRNSGIEPRRSQRRGLNFGFTLIELIVSISVIGILLFLLLPAVQAARASARRISCANNVHQLALSLTQFETSRGYYPPATSLHNSETPWRGWYSQILPFVEEASAGEEIDAAYARSKSVFGSPDHPLMGTVIETFLCPEDGRIFEPVIAGRSGLFVGLTSYLGNSGTNSHSKNGVLYGGSRIRPADISDGLSNTYLFGERPPSPLFDLGWWYAGVGTGDGTLDHSLGARETADSMFATCGSGERGFQAGDVRDECSALHLWSLHAGGAYFGMADGSVRFMNYGSAEIVESLSTRASGELPQ